MSEELKQALLESKNVGANTNYSILVDECIEKNNINIQGAYGNTLLMYACWYIHIDNLISLLLDNGANVNIQNNNGMTALMYAAFWHNVFAVELLLKYGANPNLKDESGNTVKRYASDNNIVKMLEKAEQNYTEELNVQGDPLGELEEEIRRVLKL